MTDYAMAYESIVVDALNGNFRRTDILGLGDTDEWNNETSGFSENPNHVPFGVIIALGAAIKRAQKLSTETSQCYSDMKKLFERLRDAKEYDDYCRIVEDTRTAFDLYDIRWAVTDSNRPK